MSFDTIVLAVIYLVFEWRDLDSAVGTPITGVLFHPLVPVTGVHVQELFLLFHALFLPFHILASFVMPAF